jgi:hypothetical protein
MAAWWFPNLPRREDKLATLAIKLPQAEARPAPEDYPILLASRIQRLADQEEPDRLQELAEDAGLEAEGIGAQAVERSELVEEVIDSLRGPRVKRKPNPEMAEVAEEMDLEAMLGDLT